MSRQPFIDGNETPEDQAGLWFGESVVSADHFLTSLPPRCVDAIKAFKSLKNN